MLSVCDGVRVSVDVDGDDFIAQYISVSVSKHNFDELVGHSWKRVVGRVRRRLVRIRSGRLGWANRLGARSYCNGIEYENP